MDFAVPSAYLKQRNRRNCRHMRCECPTVRCACAVLFCAPCVQAHYTPGTKVLQPATRKRHAWRAPNLQYESSKRFRSAIVSFTYPRKSGARRSSRCPWHYTAAQTHGFILRGAKVRKRAAHDRFLVGESVVPAPEGAQPLVVAREQKILRPHVSMRAHATAGVRNVA